MLLSDYSYTKWNSRTKKYYVGLGYKYTKIGELFKVQLKDLPKHSRALVSVKCDYCGKIYDLEWGIYLINHKNSLIEKDCCRNKECTGKKASESLIKKYGTRNIFEIPEIKNKKIQTNLKRYGCKNPFENEQVKEKIKKTNLERYGVESTMQNPDIVLKSQKTCMEKYGVKNYGSIYSEEHKKELSPTWKGGTEYSRVERATYEYNHWRKDVFGRDYYTCQKCGARNGNGKYVRLEAHHICNWKDNIEKRYDIDNGITFCQSCHIQFHSKFGKKDNNLQQLKEFLNIDEKIC